MKSESKNIELKIASTLNGIIQIGFSAFWIWHFGHLWYSYNFHPLISHFYMYPEWSLFVFILMAIIGVGIGFFVVVRKRKIISGYKVVFGLFILGIITNLLVVS